MPLSICHCVRISGCVVRSAAAAAGATLATPAHRILPMAVAAPVPTTTPRARPAVTTVPLNNMLVLSCQQSNRRQVDLEPCAAKSGGLFGAGAGLHGAEGRWLA